MKRFFNDVKRFMPYCTYAAKSDLKSEVASSYLNWLWWVLEPLCLMLIYTFIFGYVFPGAELYMPVFIFIGLTLWNFFNNTITFSVNCVKTKKSIISKVYIPKYILILQRMFVNAFKMGVSLLIIAGMLIVFRVPIGFNLLWFPVILVVMFVFTFALSVHLLHYGVFVEDLANVIRIVLRLVFYMTGIFFNIETRFDNKQLSNLLLKINPMASITASMRKAVLYDTQPDFIILGITLGVSILVAIWGVARIYKYENSYAKVI